MMWLKIPFLLYLALGPPLTPAHGAPISHKDYFKIMVLDEETGRGVPLVELSGFDNVRHYTDSRGVIAFYEPSLMGQKVFFRVRSHGYEFPVNEMFGERGAVLRPERGGAATLKIRRLNIAERLYRMTGEGIYLDSVFVGDPVPIKQPLLNGKVIGQDTVVAAPYRGKIYWFWGDTTGPAHYNFSASGATSELPGKGGLDPSEGVDFIYFVDESGFPKPMCPFEAPGEFRWIEGLMTVPDETGRELLAARYVNLKVMEGDVKVVEWGLLAFNDEKQEFERLVRFDLQEGHASAHPFRVFVDGTEYYYLLPNFRVEAHLDHLKDLRRYESFTPLKAGDSTDALDRSAKGVLRYRWKAGMDRFDFQKQIKLYEAGQLKEDEAWSQLRDIETGERIVDDYISVSWNEHRRRWIGFAGGFGDVWYMEADTPLGPWVYARKIVTHDRYNLYNIAHHPFFNQQDGRLVYFEGTYADTYTDAPVKTPRYDYNQIMYRLDLNDSRLYLPVPVYRMTGGADNSRLLMREGVEAAQSWGKIQEIAFFAWPPNRRPRGTRVLKAGKLEFAVSISPAVAVSENSKNVVALYEYRKEGKGHLTYSVNSDWKLSGWRRSAEPAGWAWRNPQSLLLLDRKAKPSP